MSNCCNWVPDDAVILVQCDKCHFSNKGHRGRCGEYDRGDRCDCSDVWYPYMRTGTSWTSEHCRRGCGCRGWSCP